MAAYVLVPGGYAPRCWQRVASLLERYGHRVATMNLFGSREGGDPTSTAPSALQRVEELDGGVIVVGHSSGDSVLSAAIDAAGPEHVSRLVYVCAEYAGSIFDERPGSVPRSYLQWTLERANENCDQSSMMSAPEELAEVLDELGDPALLRLEFGSDAWLRALTNEFIRSRLGKTNVPDVTVCEVYRGVPRHLAADGTIAWTLRVRDAVVSVSATECPDEEADRKSEGDYFAMQRLGRTYVGPGSESAFQALIDAVAARGQVRTLRGQSTSHAGFGVHNRLCVQTL